MAVKMLGGAVLAAMLTVSGAEAQSLAQIGGPANVPPRSFKGQQFVDSRGCLFLRAGFGGSVNWVARVDRNHKPICGMPPTGGAAAQAALAADMAPDPQAVPQVQVATAPLVAPTVAPNSSGGTQTATATQGGFSLGQLFGSGTKPSPAPAPTVFVSAKEPNAQAKVVVQTAQTYAVSGVATSVAGVQCYDATPRLVRVQVSGGTALVCTRGDGSTTGWRPPMVANARQAQIAAQTAPLVVMPAATAVVAGMQTAPVQVAPVQVVVPVAMAAQPAARSHDLPKPPKGWVYAWKDDRLNPLRGLGTTQGQAEQDQVWARTVPMLLVADVAKKATVGRALGLHTTVSTMSAAADQPAAQKAAPVVQQASAVPQGAGHLMVQVGCFGEAANAQGTASKLAALGLPVSTAATTRKGRTLQIVYAGPFGSLSEAQAGLAALRAAGFADAFLR